MSHYCCKKCGQRYEYCDCKSQTVEDVVSDPIATIEEWLMFFLLMREAFGPDAVIKTYAGYSNVEMNMEGL
jgi:hypothetical protein